VLTQVARIQPTVSFPDPPGAAVEKRAVTPREPAGTSRASVAQAARFSVAISIEIRLVSKRRIAPINQATPTVTPTELLERVAYAWLGRVVARFGGLRCS